MGKLVGNDINILTVTADDGGSGKGVDGVLHAYILLVTTFNQTVAAYIPP